MLASEQFSKMDIRKCLKTPSAPPTLETTGSTPFLAATYTNSVAGDLLLFLLLFAENHVSQKKYTDAESVDEELLQLRVCHAAL